MNVPKDKPQNRNLQSLGSATALPVLLGLGALLAWMSWQKWPDLLIDFGLQAYIPWRLAEGEVLYRDLVFFHGPLSVYLHALLFQLFGPGLLTLAVFNLGIIACLTGLIFHLFQKMSHAWAATAGGAVFLCVSAFAQLIPVGNYNFVTPYQYELTHGIFLAFLGLAVFLRYLETGRTWQAGLLGGLTGLIFLTKTEVFLAAFTAFLSGLVLVLWKRRAGPGAWTRTLSSFLGTLVLPALGFGLYFSLHLPAGEAFAAVISPWKHVLNDSIRALPFYQSVQGLDAPGANLLQLLKFALVLGGVLLVLVGLNHLLRPTAERWSSTPLLAALAVAAPALIFLREIPWFQLLRPLPLFLVAYAGFQFRTVLRSPAERSRLMPALPMLVLAIFSLVLLLKMVLNTHVFHYGFALALPAVLVLVYALLADLPRWVERWSRTATVYRAAASALLIIFMGVHVWVSSQYYGAKTFPVGEGRDTLYGYDPRMNGRSMVIRVTLDVIEETLPTDASFAALPMGAQFNYLTRRPNPIPYPVYGPVEWSALGEAPLLNALKARPPKFLLLMDVDYSEFGLRHFGRDYGQSVYSWIRNNYTSIKLVGPEPFTGQGFGIQILKRIEGYG